MLGMPDVAYSQWVLRVDLKEIAMYGRRGVPASTIIAAPTPKEDAQPDKVIVTRKRKNAKKGAA
jgi:hypothetical protein